VITFSIARGSCTNSVAKYVRSFDVARILVRQAELGDVERIIDVLVAEDLCMLDGLEAKVARSLDCSPTTCLVALDGDECVGAALAVFNGFHVFLSHIAVLTTHQRTGAGTMLHEALVDRARELAPPLHSCSEL
jgi:GNAT superfamily N-acetyltransferase